MTVLLLSGPEFRSRDHPDGSMPDGRWDSPAARPLETTRQAATHTRFRQWPGDTEAILARKNADG
jgi:hypothetical protein